jgi:hypothetical protein
MKKMLDVNDPFFRPVWRRWATVAVPATWACVEWISGDPFWGLLFTAAAAYAYRELIMKAPTA